MQNACKKCSERCGFPLPAPDFSGCFGWGLWAETRVRKAFFFFFLSTCQAFTLAHICLEHDSSFKYADEVKFLSDLVGSFGGSGGVAQGACFDL